jgi:hypothetical protein
MWSPSLWRVDETHGKLGLAFTSPNNSIHGFGGLLRHRIIGVPGAL